MSDELVQQLQQLAIKRFGPRAAALDADADLFEVLGIDSLQALDLLTDLEEAFRVEVPDYELEGVTTLGGLAAVIRRRRPRATTSELRILRFRTASTTLPKRSATSLRSPRSCSARR